MADYFHNRQIPFGFNPASETEDRRREDFDLYTGSPENPLLWELKMDWLAGITGNYFFERKSIFNTKAQKFLVARPWITVFDTEQVRAFYEAKLANPTWDEGRSQWQKYLYKHVSGGDQADNEGVLVPCREADGFGRRLWDVARFLN